MKETLNEEQVKQAKKEGGGFNYPCFLVQPKHDPLLKKKDDKLLCTDTKVVEVERWIDAKAFACRLFGVPEVQVQPIEGSENEKPVPRWQVRYTGHAMGSNTIRMQSREIVTDASGHDPPWCDTREL